MEAQIEDLDLLMKKQEETIKKLQLFKTISSQPELAFLFDEIKKINVKLQEIQCTSSNKTDDKISYNNRIRFLEEKVQSVATDTESHDKAIKLIQDKIQNSLELGIISFQEKIEALHSENSARDKQKNQEFEKIYERIKADVRRLEAVIEAKVEAKVEVKPEREKVKKSVSVFEESFEESPMKVKFEEMEKKVTSALSIKSKVTNQIEDFSVKMQFLENQLDENKNLESKIHAIMKEKIGGLEQKVSLKIKQFENTASTNISKISSIIGVVNQLNENHQNLKASTTILYATLAAKCKDLEQKTNFSFETVLVLNAAVKGVQQKLRLFA